MREIDPEEFEHAQNRRSHRLYISKRFGFEGRDTTYRFGWKRFEVGPLKELVKKGEEFVLHETETRSRN